MKLGIFSGTLLVLALALALAFASSLEPTAGGVIALAFVPVLLTGVFASRTEKRSWYFGVLVSCAGSFAAQRPSFLAAPRA